MEKILKGHTTHMTETGLTSEEAARRLLRQGANELRGSSGRSFLWLAAEVLREPMFLLLLTCGILYWVLGDRQEALILLGFVFFIMALTIVQEWKTERALSALRDLSSPRAVVVRDGVQRRIAGRDVVEGDLLILSEGDRVPADARLVSASHMAVDESLLTGESVPVRKRPSADNRTQCPGASGTLEDSDETKIDQTNFTADPTSPRPGGDDLAFVFASTLVVQGQGVARVIATGPRSEVGKIGAALKSLAPESTPLQKETHALVRRLAVGASALCVGVIVVYGLTRGDWMGGFLAGLTLAMAILPNEFPMVLVIFLSLGAWRLSKKRVLTRRMSAVETLGAATVLCVDKTGTLTQNRMALHTVYADAQTFRLNSTPLPPPFHPLIDFGLLASQPSPVDPMEQAVERVHSPERGMPARTHQGWTRVHEYPLSRGLLAMSNLWVSPDGTQAFASAKGAPEAIFDLCHLPDTQRQRLSKVLDTLSSEGLRVLGVATATPPATTRPTNQHDFDFNFTGLLGFLDPVRPGVPAAVTDAQRAGIRVVMITGDHPGTALSVAQAIGIEQADHALTGVDLERLSETDLRAAVGKTNIFARVVPEQKLRLVQALKARGEIVAMTGDGVNDAPALKAAHIGIAMGERGTDVAREAADLVLLDDDFSSLVAGVRLGRRVFDNLKKGLAYILAVHIPIAGMTLVPVALKWPMILLPVHIAFLHLIIDPAGSVVFEAEEEEKDVMSRPPRDPAMPLFGQDLWTTSFFQGGVVTAVVLSLYAMALHRGQPTDDARAVTFTALIIANVGLIFAHRSRTRTAAGLLTSRHAALWWVTLGSIGFLALVLLVPFLRTMFHFSRLHAADIGLCLLAGTICVVWFEGTRWGRSRR
jgi:Ca2+-transporting ATPase